METTETEKFSAQQSQSGASAEQSNEKGLHAAKQATGLQLIAFVFILALATKMFLLPIYLIRATGRDGYIALAMGGGLDLLSLGLGLVAMKLSPDTDFFTLIKSVLGNVGSKIAALLIGLFLFFKLNISASEVLTFYSDSVFADFDAALMIVILLAFLAAIGKHTLRALCRLGEFLTPIIIVCIVILAAIVIMTGFDLANILPVMRSPDFAPEAFRHAAWIGDFTPLVLFIGRTKMKKHTATFAAVSGVVGTTVAVFFALALCAAFGNVPGLVDSSTNISSILQYSIGNVYGRIDLFSSVLWSISAFIEAALFFYATARCFSYVIGKNAHLAISIGVCVAVYFVQVFAMTDPTIFSAVVTSWAAAIITVAFTFAVPVTAAVCAGVERARQRKAGCGR